MNEKTTNTKSKQLQDNGVFFNYRKYYESITGKKIKKGHDIHHLDHNRNNNNFDNLACIPSNLHKSYHSYVRLVESWGELFINNKSKEVEEIYYSEYKKYLSYIKIVKNKKAEIIEYKNKSLGVA